MRALKPELTTLGNLLKFEFKKFFFGVSNGQFSTCYPYARIVYSLGSSEASFMIDGKQKVDLERGMWMLLPPFTEVRHHHAHHRQLSLHFSYSLLRGIEILSVFSHIQYGYAPELLEMIEQMEPEEPFCFLNDAEIVVRTILKKIMMLPEFSLRGEGNWKLLRYNRLTEYLHRHLSSKVTVADMAKVMNMSAQVFARRFVADTGMTPRKFNENIVIEEAIKLLEAEELSIKEIAEKLHFSSEYYFSRFFKRSMNLPPGAFRKKRMLV